jgi:tetratricopeptide (TPR) repeat protein
MRSGIYGWLLTAALLVTPAGAQVKDVEQELLEGILPKERPIGLQEIRRNPEGFRNLRVAFVGQFHGLERMYVPFFTFFTPEEYVNISAWADEQNLFDPQDYGDDFAYLFISKDNTAIQELVRLRRYERFRAEGIVRNIFKGIPWIEIKKVEVEEGRWTDERLTRMVRGLHAERQGDWRTAYTEYSMLDLKELPPRGVAEAWKRMGIVQRRMGQNQKAIECLREALELRPGDAEASQELNQALVAIGKKKAPQPTAVVRQTPTPPQAEEPKPETPATPPAATPPAATPPQPPVENGGGATPPQPPPPGGAATNPPPENKDPGGKK